MDGELAGSTDFGNGVVPVLMEIDQTAGLEALNLFELKKWDWIGTEVERSCFFEHFIALRVFPQAAATRPKTRNVWARILGKDNAQIRAFIAAHEALFRFALRTDFGP